MLIFILFKLCISPPLFYIKVYAVCASKLSYSFANKCSTFHNYLFLILYWFLVLYTYLNFVSYLLFYIRHIIIVDELTKANSKQLRCLAINK